MRVAITGGTGLLGQGLMRALAGQAEAIRVLVRYADDDTRIRELGAEPVRGDLAVEGGCDGLVREGDIVFHAAARVDLTGKWRVFKETNVEGTRRLLAAALPKHPARFVYISSAGVYSAAAAHGKLIRADLTAAEPPRYNYYARAKIEAERLVKTQCERAGCSWNIVRPAFIYGPETRTLINNFARLLKRGSVCIIGPGTNRIATTYVDDTARAILLAATVPQAHGKVYDIASDEAITQMEFVNAIADAVGAPRPTRHVPPSLAFGAACVADLLSRLPGVELPFTRAMIELMNTDQRVDSSITRNELGWKHETSFAEGMRRMREWYSAQSAKSCSPSC